ncbi:MAG TPA: IclR family transcriptional regulator [Burkholderiales bacterium]
MAEVLRGTQSIARAMALARAVASRPLLGWRLTDLAAHCGLDKGTAHRMLTALSRERMVQQREADRHYVPGPLLFELGLALPHLSAFQAACEAALTRLARRHGAVMFMYLLSGEEFVCAVRVGTTALKGLSIEVGTRRPLAVSAIGAAMLAALPQPRQARTIAANLKQVASFGAARLAGVERMVRRSRRHGYGINLADVVPGINAYGVPLFDARGQVFAAIGFAAAVQDFPRARSGEAEAMLLAEARRIERDNAPTIAALTE